MESNSKPFLIFDLLLKLFNQDNAKIVSLEFLKHDLETALDFLKYYPNRYKKTFILYLFEIEHLLLWAWLIVKKSILCLNDEDIQKYIAFRLDISAFGIEIEKNLHFNNDENLQTPYQHWRPFILTVIKKKDKEKVKKYRFLERGFKEIINILDEFYNFLLVKGKVLNHSLLALAQEKNKYISRQNLPINVKKLTEIQWQYCVKIAEKLAADEPNRHERTLFMIMIFYWLYPHVVELTARGDWIPQMNHFYRDRNQNWQFKVLDEKKKIRVISVGHEMLEALKRYRISFGLTPLPSRVDTNPLMLNEEDQPITHQSAIRKIVQDCFDKVIKELRKDNLMSEADMMELATITYLRQRGMIDDINQHGFSKTQVYKKAGQSLCGLSIYRYNDSQMKERHQSAKNKKLLKGF
ncbi:MAG: Phage integrase family protein [Gammaproteobacteria bacterium]|jgi:site-specific recombinase XerD|nr:Phage integrase family protein [Gammaproteobacteria bacterium]